MPTETTKLGGLLTALSNICEEPLPPAPEKTCSDNNVDVTTIDPASVIATSSFDTPKQNAATSGIDSLAAAAACGPVITSLPVKTSGNSQRGSKRKPAPPPYPPPGYYMNKEKFLDSDDDSDVTGSEDEDEEIQYFETFATNNNELDESSSSRTSMRGRVLTTKRNKRTESEEDDDPPNRKQTKRRKPSSSISTAKPKLGGISPKKKSRYDKMQAILRPTPEDILAGRGGGTNRHDGNIRFRAEARKLRSVYKDEETDRRTKYVLSQELVTRVKQYGGRFLEKGHDGKWYEMDEKSARKKASQVLREEKWE